MKPPDDHPDEADRLDLPRTNPVPLVIAGIVAVVILGGLGFLLLGGSDDDVPDLSDGTSATVDPDEVAADGDPVTERSFRYLDGSGPDQPEGRFTDYEGQPLVVNFFAEWCAPCVAEMPDLQQAFEQYGDDVGFIGIGTNDTPEKIRKLVRQTGIGYTVAVDTEGEAVFADFGGIIMPSTAFVDADGKVVRVWSGPITEAELGHVIEQDLLE